MAATLTTWRDALVQIVGIADTSGRLWLRHWMVDHMSCPDFARDVLGRLAPQLAAFPAPLWIGGAPTLRSQGDRGTDPPRAADDRLWLLESVPDNPPNPASALRLTVLLSTGVFENSI